MSRDLQPGRIRILSSGGALPIGARRRDDPEDADAIGLVELDFDEGEAEERLHSTKHIVPKAKPGLSILSIATLFLFSSAVSGACAIAFGLFTVASR